MSSKDIDRGALWFSEISDQLADTSVGIICLTKENRNKPWILFESGALAKGISSNRVCTFLIDLKPTDVENPLAQFNHSQTTKSGVWDLVRTINSTLEDKKLTEKILEKVFETYWPQFNNSFKEIIKNTKEGEVIETRSENDILIEVLSSIRSMDRRMRFVENKTIHNINKNHNSIEKRPDKYEAEKILRELVESGMSPENIMIEMRNLRIPSSFIKRKVSEYLKDQKE